MTGVMNLEAELYTDLPIMGEPVKKIKSKRSLSIRAASSGPPVITW